MVKKGKPEFPDAFEKYTQDGLSIYYDYSLPPKDEMVIGLQIIGDMKLLVPGPDRL